MTLSHEECNGPLLSQLVASELELPLRLEVLDHVAGCERCQSTVETLKQLGTLLPGLTAQLSAAPVDRTLELARAAARANSLQESAPELSESESERPAQDRPRMVAWTLSISLAAALALSLGLPFLQKIDRSGPPQTAEEISFQAKGTGNQVEPIALSFSVQHGDGALARGENGAVYGGTDTLFFRAQLPQNGYFLLVRVGQNDLEPLQASPQSGGSRVVAQPVPQGQWDLSDGHTLLGFGLGDVRGPQRFVALFSRTAFEVTPALREALVRGSSAADLLRKFSLISDELIIQTHVDSR